jgi:hypothetical protein
MSADTYNHRLERAIANIVDPVSAAGLEIGVAVIDPNGQLIAGTNEGIPDEALSLSKLIPAYAGSLAAAHGIFHPDTPLLVSHSDLTVAPGGFLHLLAESGRPVTLRQATAAMLRYSDTTAQRMMVRLLGGPDNTNAVIRAHPPYGTPIGVTGLQTVRGQEGRADARFFTGDTTPLEIARLFGRTIMDDGNYLDLRQGAFSHGLRRNLPGDVPLDASVHALLAEVRQSGAITDEQLVELLRSDRPVTPYPNIMGLDEGSRHDVANIGPAVVAVMARGYDPNLPEDPSHPAHDIQAQIGRVVHQHVGA